MYSRYRLSFILKIFVALYSSAMLFGCGKSTPQKPAPAQVSPDTFAQIGDYQLHYNALSTEDLPVDVARQYGIQRDKHRGLVVVSVLQKNAKEPGFQPVAANVLVEMRNVLDLRAPIAMRRIDESGSISYIGEIGIEHRQSMMFEIKATPSATGSTTQVLAAKFQHEFFID